MIKYNEQPAGVYPVSDTSAFLKDTVKPGYYTIAFDDDRKTFFLAYAQPFEINHKVYGNSLQYADRILNTFQRRLGKNTTAAFEGLKGSGKTLLAKKICMSFVATGGIVITCNTAFCGDMFNKFLQDIAQPKIVFFDEFEKTYAEREQRDGILTLFDGTWQSHTLYLLTTNTDMYNNSGLEYFSNRPGRVYFNIKFKAVDLEAIKEYCQDNLDNFETRFKLVEVFIRSFRAFNMDMLSVLVTEMNLNPELTPTDLSDFLNIKPDASARDRNLTCSFKIKGVDVTSQVDSFPSAYNLQNFLNPLNTEYSLYIYMQDGEQATRPAGGELLSDSQISDVTYTLPPNSNINQTEEGVILVSDPTDPDVVLEITVEKMITRSPIIY